LKKDFYIHTKKDKTLGKEKRWAFVDQNSGSYYVVRRPTIKNDLQLRHEMAYYDPTDDNNKEIQEQFKKPLDKVLY